MKKKMRILLTMTILATAMCIVLTGCGKEMVQPAEKETGATQLEYKDDNHTVESRPQLAEVDPFENVLFPMVGNSGEAYFQGAFAWAYIPTSQGTMKTMIGLKITEENNKGYSNGDKVYAYLTEEVDAERIAREYGVVFTRTEGEIEISGLNAYGQPGASNGEHATINLNDYLVINDWTGENGQGYTQIRIDYDAIISDFYKSISTNVAPEDMLGASLPRHAVDGVFEYRPPFRIICTSHDCYPSGSYIDLGSHFSNGDVVKLSWQANEEGLQLLSKLMNVDFVYEDFEITVSGLK